MGPRRPSRTGSLLSVLILAGGLSSASAATHLVQMVNFAFEPNSLTIAAGDTVVWTNTTATFHNVVSSNSVWAPPPTFTSPGTFSFTFNSAGIYGYYCAPHHAFGMTGVIAVEGSANLPPVVSLTSPAAGLTLAAPANVLLSATASDPDGSIASVEFFSGATPLGSVTSSPYSLTVSNLQAGPPYSFTAKAVDNQGASTTSGAITVSVVTPGVLQFAAPGPPANSAFTLQLTVTPGLRYAIDDADALGNWSELTNFVAANSVVTFDTAAAGNAQRFFRARLLPNP